MGFYMAPLKPMHLCTKYIVESLKPMQIETKYKLMATQETKNLLKPMRLPRNLCERRRRRHSKQHAKGKPTLGLPASSFEMRFQSPGYGGRTSRSNSPKPPIYFFVLLGLLGESKNVHDLFI